MKEKNGVFLSKAKKDEISNRLKRASKSLDDLSKHIQEMLDETGLSFEEAWEEFQDERNRIAIEALKKFGIDWNKLKKH
ncbi:MAG: hypothetical protein EU535_08175 [Promethearchaeota archaeon]|nr:MAG: hypothetical protein EU535_08175 [Candidatus Lokiarchaeota archaeon]